MTTAQKLQNELNQMKAKFEAAREENTVVCGAPELKKTYSYRKNVAIMAHDVRL